MALTFRTTEASNEMWRRWLRVASELRTAFPVPQ
jgi:hypothetical protein